MRARAHHIESPDPLNILGSTFSDADVFLVRRPQPCARHRLRSLPAVRANVVAAASTSAHAASLSASGPVVATIQAALPMALRWRGVACGMCGPELRARSRGRSLAARGAQTCPTGVQLWFERGRALALGVCGGRAPHGRHGRRAAVGRRPMDTR